SAEIRRSPARGEASEKALRARRDLARRERCSRGGRSAILPAGGWHGRRAARNGIRIPAARSAQRRRRDGLARLVGHATETDRGRWTARWSRAAVHRAQE